MIKYKHNKKRFIVLIIVVIISVFAIIQSRSLITSEIQVQLFGNLKDVAIQNKITMENLLNDKLELLIHISEHIDSVDTLKFDTENDILLTVDWLKTFNEIYGFKRMGFISAEGIAYTTDGYQSVLMDEPYFMGMEGHSHISRTLTDAVGTEEPINVFSTPIFSKEDNSVIGVLFATYRTESFKELLNIDSYDGQGFSYIIMGDGTVITDSVQSPLYGTTNVFETLLEYSDKNIPAVNRLKEAIKNKESGYDTFITINERSLYYTPITVDAFHETWYLLTIVPAQVLEQKTDSLLLYQEILILVIIISITCLVLYFIYTYRKDARLLSNLAYLDPLTNGSNTHAFYEWLKNIDNPNGYIISVDLNDFKLVNSVCGIAKGNETIKCIWDIIDKSLTDGELAAHIGGDHYVMFLKEDNKDAVIKRIKEISSQIEELSDTLNIINIIPYFGIYEYNTAEGTEENYNRSNQAKKLVKGNKDKNYAFYEELDLNLIIEEKNLIDSFKSAIQNDEFEVWYQPKYHSSPDGDAQIVGAEALVRWRKSDGTLIPPYRFIPLFERNGMIITLDEYIFRKVCMQQKNREMEGLKLFPVSVNISRASLYYGNIVERYKEILKACKITPDLVPLEITESATINNGQIQSLVHDFHDAGFPLHLDDFGNGYSSIATLNLIPFDTLKLDKSLVDFIGDKSGELLITYTIKLAQSLGMKITAEGVETKEQVEFLNHLACDEIQGYYYSKPLPLMDFELLINEQLA